MARRETPINFDVKQVSFSELRLVWVLWQQQPPKKSKPFWEKSETGTHTEQNEEKTWDFFVWSEVIMPLFNWDVNLLGSTAFIMLCLFFQAIHIQGKRDIEGRKRKKPSLGILCLSFGMVQVWHIFWSPTGDFSLYPPFICVQKCFKRLIFWSISPRERNN